MLFDYIRYAVDLWKPLTQGYEVCKLSAKTHGRTTFVLALGAQTLLHHNAQHGCSAVWASLLLCFLWQCY